MWFIQSLRLLRHELRRGELTIVCLSIILAVSAVFSLTGFSSKIQQAIEGQSSSFIAADNVLQSSRAIDEDFFATPSDETLSYQSAQQLLFSSMAFANDKLQLAEVTAVTAGYPLRGELLIEDAQGNITSNLGKPPGLGQVWVGAKLLQVLGIQIGDSIELGAANFVIAGVINFQPDASFSVFTNGPAILMNMADVEKTQIIQPGSRLTYRYLFAGDKGIMEKLSEIVKPKLLDYHRWYDVKTQQSPLSQALIRAERFLSLASMLGIILAAVAVSVASRRYSQRNQPSVAVFKAMGATKAYVTKLYLTHWGCLATFSIFIGLVLGFVLQYLGLQAMSDYLPQTEYAFDSYPYLVAIATGLICAVTFAISPLQQLVNTSPLAVIRGFEVQAYKFKVLIHLPAVISIAALLWLFSGNVKLTTTLFVSAAVVVTVLLLLGQLFVSASRRVGTRAGKALHLATANLKRRAKQNSVQLVSFTIAIKLLLLILVVRNELINDWQAQLPENAPNHFFVNVTKDQVPELEQFLSDHNLYASDIYPVVRGRLAAINDERLTRNVSKEEVDKSNQGREGIGRELNLTWRESMPAEAKIIEGQWWSDTSDTAQVSVESQLAERLDIKLGDKLTFQFGSQESVAEVTSLREVDWQSMQPNFFMILSPSVLSGFPATYIASAQVPKESRFALQQFLMSAPTISVIDVDAMIDQLRKVIEQVTLAIEFILALVVIAGTLVLIAQVQASMEEREREFAILRTLGAKGSLLRNSVLFEFVALGAIAGLLAAIAMESSVAVLQKQVFDIEPTLHPMAWLVGPVSGGVFVGIVGLISCWRLLKMTSVTLIRRTL